MIYRIAFASSDGRVIDRHFGHADKFYIYDIDTQNGSYAFEKETYVTPPCNGGEHEDFSFEAVLDRLGDVQAVIVKRIGAGASIFLEQRGIAVYQAPFGVEDILEKIVTDKTWEEDQWQFHTRS